MMTLKILWVGLEMITMVALIEILKSTLTRDYIDHRQKHSYTEGVVWLQILASIVWAAR